MAFLDHIWPFSRIRHLRQDNARLAYRYEKMLEAYNNDVNHFADKYQRSHSEVLRLEEILREAHFRNPETGRLMKKGKLP